MKKERKMKNMDSDAKSSTISKRFTVVVVTFFVKILDDFNDFVSECVSFSRKINNPFCGLTVFPKKSDNMFIGRETKTHIFSDENQRKKSRRSAHLTIIILLEYYNHSTTTTTHNNNTQQQEQQQQQQQQEGAVCPKRAFSLFCLCHLHDGPWRAALEECCSATQRATAPLHVAA